VKTTNFVFGYHGTTNAFADGIRKNGFRISRRTGLWLGFGRYFFQDAPIYAFRWAQDLAERETGDRGNATVLYTEIDLRQCIDLTDRTHWSAILSVWENEVKDTGISQLGVDVLLKRLAMTDAERAALTQQDKDALGMHYVDCQVMNLFIQKIRDKMRQKGFDYTTIRAAVPGGRPVYEDSWLWTRSAVMISVLEPGAMSQLEQLSESDLLELAAAS
jgi:hypothetical protein